MKHYIYMLPIVFVFLSTSLAAQTDFEKTRKEMEERFERMRQETSDTYDNLQRQIDAQFAEMLSQTWKEMDMIRGRVADTTPKPDTIPQARPPEKPTQIPKEEPIPVKPEPQKPELERPSAPGVTVTVDYFSTPVQITYDPTLRIPVNGPVSQGTVSEYWKAAAASNFIPVVEQCQKAGESLRLNDWEYYLFVDDLAASMYVDEGVERALFTWFILIKSGFDARLGMNDTALFLLLPTKTILYGTPYYTINNANYYLALPGSGTREVGSLKTYDGTHESARNTVDLAVHDSPLISGAFDTRRLSFVWNGVSYSLTVPINRSVVQLMEWYPQTEFPVYFTAAVPEETSKALLAGLRPIVGGKPETEAINILLRFVQNAFVYRTDKDQFGREKYFFPEETIFYHASDCEDRAVLFAYLVRQLLGNDVIGLHYPGHMATAVRLESPVPGTSIEYRGKRYTVCDPTYINANCGECMPQFQGVTPEVIDFSGMQ